MEYLTTNDLNTLGFWLSPDFLVPLARHYGGGDPVVGAKRAYDEVRNLIRSYASYVRWRENRRGDRDIGLAQALRALGYVGGFHRIVPVKEPVLFRKTAFSIWKMGIGSEIPGEVTVRVEDSRRIKAAAIKTISLMLKEIPELNLAVLDNRVWQRKTPEIMLNVVVHGEIRSIIFSAARRTLSEVNAHLVRSLRKLIEIEEHPLRFMANKVLETWADHYWATEGTGFIASPAGAMVSFMPKKRIPARGHAALTLFNGIPLAVVVSIMDEGLVSFNCTPSHVAIDGNTMDLGYEFIHDVFPKVLMGV